MNEIPVRAGWRGEAPTNRLTIMMKTFRQNMNEYVVFKDKKKGSGNITKALPQKRVLGKVKDVYMLTDQKYKELSAEIIVENVDIDEDNVE